MEFKKLSDVEVVAEPTETANVLIEEDGVIKKAPKTAVGGAGGTISIVFNSNNWIDSNNGYEIISAPDNLYEMIGEAINSMTCLDIVGIDISNINNGSLYYYRPTEIWSGDTHNYFRLDWMYSVYCYQDGRISIQYYD